MVAGAEIVRQSIPVLDVFEDIVDISAVMAAAVAAAPSSPVPRRAAGRMPETAAAADIAVSEVDLKVSDAISSVSVELPLFVPSIRSGSFADIGPRGYMEDEHIRIDNLSAHLGPQLRCPTPSAFYGVFDGHGGSDVAAYIKKHATKFFFEDANFPQASEVNKDFMECVKNSIRQAFLLADLALADDHTINTSSGTTALTATLFERHLLVANVGDCRAVLCKKGEAVAMSEDHKPSHAAERQRIEQSGGFVDSGYLNGVLSVSRALGDWDIKLPRGSPSPLIAEPELKHVVLTEDDEFLILGCDGIWDVMSNQQAVNIVRSTLKRHGNPERCARELVTEALGRKTFDNLTVIVICFNECRLSSQSYDQQHPPRLRCCKTLSAEALFSLRSLLDNNGSK